MSAAVAANNGWTSFSGERKCPLCGGCEQDPRHKGIRCTGGMSLDGFTVICTRIQSERAASGATGGWIHKMRGPCSCGIEHELDAPRLRIAEPSKVRSNKKTYLSFEEAADAFARTNGGNPWQSWSYRLSGGRVAFVVVRFRLADGRKSYRPYHEQAAGVWVSGDPGGLLPLYRLPDLGSARRVFVTEGEKTADLAAAIGVTATTCAHGAQAPHKTDLSPLVGREVAIVLDHDDAGEAFGRKLAPLLLDAGVSPKIVRLPGLANQGDDLEQWLDLRWSEGKSDAEIRDELERLVDIAPFEQSSDASPVKPEIEITTDEMAVNDQVVSAIVRDPRFYVQGDAPVMVLEVGLAARGMDYRGDPGPQIRPMGLPTLRELISSTVCLVKPKRKGDAIELTPAHPPDWCVSAVHDRGVYPGARYIKGVVETPTMRGDGSILDQPGYDPATQLYFKPNDRFEAVPLHPTFTDAEAARDLLIDLVCDFPFRSRADMAVWLLALLTVLGRSSFHGPTPLFGFDANTPGSGKSLLADTIAWIATKRPMPRTSFPGGRNSDEEMRKRITSIAVAGERFSLIDNVAEPLGGASLDAALTADTWKDRILGASRMTGELPWMTTLFATGNNLQGAGDILRRVVFCRIDSPLEKPEERQGFRHPDLKTYILENRGEMVPAALTILRAYRLAGRPAPLAPLGSFEAWTQAIVEPTAWVMGANPLDVRRMIRAADQDAINRNAMIEGWAELPRADSGLTVAEVLKILNAPGHNDRFLILRSALAELSNNSDLPSPRTIGKRLAKLQGRVVGNLTIKSSKNRLNVMSWRVEQVNAGFAGFTQGFENNKPCIGSPSTANGLDSNAGFEGFESSLSREKTSGLGIPPGNSSPNRPATNPADPANPAHDPRCAIVKTFADPAQDREVFEL